MRQKGTEPTAGSKQVCLGVLYSFAGVLVNGLSCRIVFRLFISLLCLICALFWNVVYMQTVCEVGSPLRVWPSCHFRDGFLSCIWVSSTMCMNHFGCDVSLGLSASGFQNHWIHLWTGSSALSSCLAAVHCGSWYVSLILKFVARYAG